jgi:Domain of unknown function (DUF222)
MVTTGMSAVSSNVCAMTPADLLDEIAASERQVRASQSRQLGLVSQFAEAQRAGRAAGECEQTERALAMDLAAALGVSITSARMLAVDADRLTASLPAVLDALAHGRIGLFAARQVAAASATVPVELVTPEVDQALADEAGQLLPGQVKAAADTRMSALDPGAAARRADDARARRDVWTVPKPDGVATFGATLPAEQALACWTALDGHARGRRADGDDRPIAQIMCDTLVERVTGAQRADQAAVIELQVVITDQSLLGSASEPACLIGHGSIPADLAVELSAESRAWVRRLLTDPITGAVTGCDAKRRRFFGGPARDLVRIRDRRCRNPVCDAPVRDIDHRVEWAAGGATDPGNADGYCQRCHHLKDHPEITVVRIPEPERRPDGHRIAWTGPSGHAYNSLAPPALGHGTPTLAQLRERRRLLEREGPSG